MTRDQAVRIWRQFGSFRVEALNRRWAPQHIVDRMMSENAEDCVDGLIALGLLDVETPQPDGDVGNAGAPND